MDLALVEETISHPFVVHSVYVFVWTFKKKKKEESSN